VVRQRSAHRWALRADWLVSPGWRPRQAPPTLATLTGLLPRLGCDQQTILRWPVLGQQIRLPASPTTAAPSASASIPALRARRRLQSARRRQPRCRRHQLLSTLKAGEPVADRERQRAPGEHSARAARLAICRQPRDHKLERGMT